MIVLDTNVCIRILRGREDALAFAAKYGFDPRKISEAAGRIASKCGFNVVPIPVNPNFHYPEGALS